MTDTDAGKRLSDAELAKLIMSWVFGETQPDHGDVFSWLDDHVEDLARFLNKHLSPSAPVVAPSMTDLMVTPESIDLHLLGEACDWPQDLTFKFLDEPGEHDPCYVIMPGGAMLPFAHHDKNGVDQARAQFIVDACNEKIAALTANRGSVSEERAREILAQCYGKMYASRGEKPDSIRAGENPSIPANAAIAAIQQAVSECSGGGAGTVSLSELWLITKGALPVKASERFQTQAELQAWAIGIKDALAGAAKLIESRALPLPPSPVSRDAVLYDVHGLDTQDRVCFYEQDFYVLSNFSSFKVVTAHGDFPTSEHAYHYEKFLTAPPNCALLNRIREAPSAHEAFKIAERHKAERRPDWDAVKVDIMRDILHAKATQHEYVLRKLLATGDRELVENSWRDDFWGWGPNRDGQNMLGKLWMEVRAVLALKSTPHQGGEGE